MIFYSLHKPIYVHFMGFFTNKIIINLMNDAKFKTNKDLIKKQNLIIQ